eukprot:m.10952 g.10952  ORF g.10952 m.10952 type:complete len:295 (+) comp2578_c0_seq2:58-942(+)
MDDSEIEGALLAACEKFPQGAAAESLLASVPVEMKGKYVEALNRLTKKGKLELLKSQKGAPMFRVVVGENKFAGMSAEERLVYQIIQEAGNKGIWTRDIRFRTNLDVKLVNKILKTMESRKMVKAVTSVVAAKKKMYMLFELEPDQALTGGPWYSDQDFEADFINALKVVATKCLEKKYAAAMQEHRDPSARLQASYVTAADAQAYITSTKVSNVPLAEQHVAGILETLVWDGVAESVFSAAQGGRVFKLARMPVTPPDVLCAPCGVCPVFHNCAEGSVVSPSTCIYLRQWMDL